MALVSRLLLGAALLSAAPAAYAQCSFTPTVTPANLILCPQAQDTLRTQTYDAYQWYKDGQPIAGATQPFYVVEQFRDAGSQFSVEATLGGCTEQSAQVLVDGWVFAGLTVMSSGDFATDPNDGHPIICDSSALHPRDTVVFEVMQPYTTNVQWFRNNVLLPGATQPELRVTDAGTYEVEGAPAVCTSFRQRSLPLDVELRRPQSPVVALTSGQLVGTPPSGVTYRAWQWFRDSVAVAGATNPALVPPGPGAYRVQGDDGFCWAVSASFRFPVMGVENSLESVGIRFFPNPATSTLVIEAAERFELTLRTTTGAVAAHYPVAPQMVDIRALPDGLYFAHFTSAHGQQLRPVKLVKAAR